MKATHFTPILILAAPLIMSSCGEKATDSSEGNSEIIPISLTAVQRVEYATTVTATGLLNTEFETKYGFLIGGVVERIYINEGDRFRKGQLLAKLRTDEIDAGLGQALHAVEKAQRDFHRAEKLFRDSVATREQVENAKTALDVAQKQYDAVDFKSRYTSIVATSDGFVARKIGSEGEVMAAGAPLLIINETNGSGYWTLRLGLAAADWAKVQPGDSATVAIDAFPEREFQAVVHRKPLAAAPMTGILEVELKVATESTQPAVGMFARASIRTRHTQGIAYIPYDALIEANGNKAFVFVPTPDGKRVQKLPVTIARFNNAQVQISGGLEQIAHVITANSAFLNEKSLIRIQP
jgi:RND family efflux transporter MFP subunit